MSYPKSRRRVGGPVLAVATAAVMLVAGCGGDDEPPPEVAWAKKACAEVKQVSTRLAMPTADPKDSAASRDAMVKLLTDLSGRLAKQQAALKSVGAPPVEGSKPVYDKALANITKAQTQVNQAVAKLRKAEVDDEKKFKKTIAELSSSMAKFSSYQGPAKDLRTNPKLNAAMARNSGCKGL